MLNGQVQLVRTKPKLQTLLHAHIRNKQQMVPLVLAKRLKLTLWGDAH